MKRLVFILFLLSTISVNAQIGRFPFSRSITSEIDNDLLTNLVAYWTLDEASGVLVDSQGSNDMTNSGGTQNSTGKLGKCVEFVNAESDYCYTADAADLRIYDQDFTFSAWIYLNSYPGVGNAWGILGGELSSAGMTIARGEHILRAVSCGTAEGDVGSAVNSGQWNFVAVVFNTDATTNNVTYYLNGAATTATANFDFTSDRGTIFIGQLLSGNGYFDGKIDEVAIWKSRELSTDDLDLLYGSGDGFSFSLFK